MRRMLPAHQFKIGRKTYGLTQADADELYMILEGATSYQQAQEWAKVAHPYMSSEVREVLEAMAEREAQGHKVIYKHRTN